MGSEGKSEVLIHALGEGELRSGHGAEVEVQLRGKAGRHQREEGYVARVIGVSVLIKIGGSLAGSEVRIRRETRGEGRWEGDRGRRGETERERDGEGEGGRGRGRERWIVPRCR